MGNDRAPIWPTHLLGSISHCDQHAVAVVKSDQQCDGIGIDIAHIKSPASTAIKNIVVSKLEWSRLSDYKELLSETLLLTLIFSAKESFYKAAYPQVKRFFGFETLEFISLDTEKKSITFMLKSDLSADLSESTMIRIHYHLFHEPMLLTLSTI